MEQHITTDSDGNITASSDWEFPGSHLAPKKVVWAWDMTLYFEDDPRIEKPQSVVNAENSASVRAERDRRIAATDYLMASDYPLSDDKRLIVTAYRQVLRDLPAQPGFPWSGGGKDDNACPWPQAPGFLG